MMDRFREDHLKNEKKEPIESSSLRFVNIPAMLLAMFVGFGTTYLFLRTDSTSMNPGDSRTTSEKAATAPEAVKTAGEFDLPAFTEKGKRIFATICQACHQATGMGVPGAFPPLDGSEWVTGSPKQMAAIIMHGLQGSIIVKGQKFENVMPAFKDQLSHEEIAAVATYVRQAWGNKAAPVTTDLVDGVYAETKSRTESWGGEAELRRQKWE